MKLDNSRSQREHMEMSGVKQTSVFVGAMREYWSKINKLGGSVRKTFRAIDEARKELWRRLRSRRVGVANSTKASLTTASELGL